VKSKDVISRRRKRYVALGIIITEDTNKRELAKRLPVAVVRADEVCRSNAGTRIPMQTAKKEGYPRGGTSGEGVSGTQEWGRTQIGKEKQGLVGKTHPTWAKGRTSA